MSEKKPPLALIVDDEDAFLEIASARFIAGGFSVVVAHSVPEALAKAETLTLDIVISDIFMSSNGNGWELAVTLKKNHKTAHIPFAFFSSLRDPWSEFLGDRNLATSTLHDVVFVDKNNGATDLVEQIKKILQ